MALDIQKVGENHQCLHNLTNRHSLQCQHVPFTWSAIKIVIMFSDAQDQVNLFLASFTPSCCRPISLHLINLIKFI